MQKFIVIAIDGPAASGKSTLAKYLADKLVIYMLIPVQCIEQLHYYALEKNIEENEQAVIEAAKNINLNLNTVMELQMFLLMENDVTDKIRTPEVNSKVSDISRIKDVRTELVKLQQKFGENNNLIVEGRDTTTVVFPNADLKIFLNCGCF